MREVGNWYSPALGHAAKKGHGHVIDKSETKPIQTNGNRVQGVWVFAEHNERELEEGAWKLINEGRDLADKLADDLSVIIIGAGLKRITESLAFCGADKVFAIEYSPSENYSAE